MEKYFKFNGSSTRSEYWGVNIVGGICAFILAMFGTIITGASSSTFGVIVGALILIATFVAAIWLSVATAVRRCRDAGLNPWWAAAVCIPYLGWIVFVVLGCLKTDEGTK